MPKEQQGVDPRDAEPDVTGLTYEQARDELVDVVRRLESGSDSLEESLALWERGEALAARCQAWLDGARERLDAARARTAQGSEGSEGSAEDDEDDEGAAE